MKRKKRKREMVHFSGRNHSGLGVISTVIGVLVFVGFVALSIVSSTSQGNGGILLGVIGLLLLALSIYGFVLAYRSFRQKDIYYRFPVIGAVLNGLFTILFIVLYIVGIF